MFAMTVLIVIIRVFGYNNNNIIIIIIIIRSTS